MIIKQKLIHPLSMIIKIMSIVNRYYYGNHNRILVMMNVRILIMKLLKNLIYLFISFVLVREFIDLAKEVANMNEEQSLGFLTALDFHLKECIQILSQLSFAPQPMDYAERAHIERFIFTEHKLDMIKVMINDDDIVVVCLDDFFVFGSYFWLFQNREKRLIIFFVFFGRFFVVKADV